MNQKGFISIPVIIAIVVGVLILGGGYLGLRKYTDYQVDKIQKEKITQKEENKAQALAEAQSKILEQSQKEIKNLQEKNSEMQQQQNELKQEIDAKASPTIVPEESFSTADIVLKNKKYIFSIVCHTDSGSIGGSGVLIGRSKDGLIILTNYHITKDARKYLLKPPCFVRNSALGESYYGQPIYFANVASLAIMDSIDFAFIEIKEPIPSETLYYDKDSGKYITQPNIPKTTLLLTSTFPKICAQDSLVAGEEVVVLGYPAIGGDIGGSSGPNLGQLITTEGIISNDVRSFDNYFVSSAKIEQGNSGGGAFLKSKNCFAGVPTYAVVGAIESLSRLINLPKLNQDYLSKVFSDL